METKVCKRILLCLAIIIYVILIAALFAFEGTNMRPFELIKDCIGNKPCLVLCETNNKNLSNKYVKEHFPYNYFRDRANFVEDKKDKVIIIKYSVKCNLFEEKKIYCDKNELFISTNYVHHWIKKERYQKFCFNVYEKSEGLDTNLEVCERDEIAVKIIHFSLLVTTLILFALPLAVYIYKIEIFKTKNGKFCIGLLMLQIFMVSIYFFIDKIDQNLFVVLIIFGIISSIVMNCMYFDILQTFINSNDFKIKNYYVVRFIIFFLTFIALKFIGHYLERHKRLRNKEGFFQLFFSSSSFLIFFVIISMNWITMIFVIFHYFKEKKIASDIGRFSCESERLWMYVKFFIILTLMWLIKIKSTHAMVNSYISLLIGDMILCFSAGLVAILLLSRSSVYKLLFEKGNGIKSNENNNE
ncbi:hypothetical protein PVAND_010368 [Polypedilum vanderplanki]|uniref:Uncharacterized protein n=1 Tax=Polypedilum vanderplanki TaxID=319348 RepID=A0A9J6CFC1_POLVA|nr:hypothetical protein PVAND_010368 [Polypedilum vanderplanki]